MRSSVDNINAYLLEGPDAYVFPSAHPLSPSLVPMQYGNKPSDGGHLILSVEEAEEAKSLFPEVGKFIKPFIGSHSSLRGKVRFCIWVTHEEKEEAHAIPILQDRFSRVWETRMKSPDKGARSRAEIPHRFSETRKVSDKIAREGSQVLVIPRVSSIRRYYTPASLALGISVICDTCFFIPDSNLATMAVISSRAHRVWSELLSPKMKDDINYANKIAWNTFPVPELHGNTTVNLEESGRCIISARANHPDKTLAYLYSSETMPNDLKEAHVENDRLVDKIVVGKECQSDKERLSLLFDRYQEMTAPKPNSAPTLQFLF